jgi:hypothetical protein
MNLAKKVEDEKKVDQNHYGSVAPEDEGLTKWIIDLWARQEHPERVEVWQVFGKEKRDRGEQIFHRDFAPDNKLDTEKCNHLANTMIAEAQNDTDCTPRRRESYFQIVVIDRNRRATPLTRRLGPFTPKRSLAVVRDGDPATAETDEEEMTIRNLELARYKTGLEEIRWQSNRNDRVLGELLLLYRDIVGSQGDEIQKLRFQVNEGFTRLNDAEDRRAQRDVMLEKEKFKIGLMKEGVRAGRNLLPGLFAAAREDSERDGVQQPTNGHSNGHGNGSNGGAPKMQPQYGPSPERTLVDNFIHDCEEEGLLDKLFGEGEIKDGKLVVTMPGIFSPDQVGVLIGVRGGFLPVTTLDPLMPESGHKISITMEQVQKALDAGLTEGIGMAIMELKEMRKRALEAASEKNAGGTANNNAPEATT